MARFRLSDPAMADMARLLRVSESEHGAPASIRYQALLAAALRRIADDPQAARTVDRSRLIPGLRSLHLRHVRIASPDIRVAAPVHVVFYRAAEPDLIEIVRVLHERMEPRRHVGARPASTKRRPQRDRA